MHIDAYFSFTTYRRGLLREEETDVSKEVGGIDLHERDD
jgi:hypothetical protein